MESETDPKWDRSCPFTRDLDRSRSVLGPFLKWTHIVPGKWTHIVPVSEVPCERKACLDSILDPSQIYPVSCKRGLNHFSIKHLTVIFLQTYSLLRRGNARFRQTRRLFPPFCLFLRGRLLTTYETERKTLRRSVVHSLREIIGTAGEIRQDARRKQKSRRKLFMHMSKKSASNKRLPRLHTVGF